MYKFREFYIPDHMMGALKRYIEHGLQPGDFLTAVLSNDLQEAVGRADDENMRNLPAYIAYLYNEAPSACWGSKDNIKSWLDFKAIGRARKEAMPSLEPCGSDDFTGGAL